VECNPLWRRRDEVRGEIRERSDRVPNLFPASAACRLHGARASVRCRRLHGKTTNVRPAPPGSIGRLRLPRSGALDRHRRTRADMTKAPPSDARWGLLVDRVRLVLVLRCRLLCGLRRRRRRAPASLRGCRSGRTRARLPQLLVGPSGLHRRVPRPAVPLARLGRLALLRVRVVRRIRELADRGHLCLELCFQQTTSRRGGILRVHLCIAHDTQLTVRRVTPTRTKCSTVPVQARNAFGTDEAESRTEQAIQLPGVTGLASGRCASSAAYWSYGPRRVAGSLRWAGEVR